MAFHGIRGSFLRVRLKQGCSIFGCIMGPVLPDNSIYGFVGSGFGVQGWGVFKLQSLGTLNPKF